MDHGTLYSARNNEKEKDEQKMKDAENLANDFFRNLGDSLGITIPGIPKREIISGDSSTLPAGYRKSFTVTPGTSPAYQRKAKADGLDLIRSDEAPASLIGKQDEPAEFMARMNNAGVDRKKRNVTFHGIPEV